MVLSLWPFFQWAIYRRLPLKSMSRAWGRFNQRELPNWFRGPGFRFYIWLFGVKLEEALIQDLCQYRNLSEFFRRRLRSEVRPIQYNSLLVRKVENCLLSKGHPVVLRDPCEASLLWYLRLTMQSVQKLPGFVVYYCTCCTTSAEYKNLPIIEFCIQKKKPHKDRAESGYVVGPECGTGLCVSAKKNCFKKTNQ